MGAQEEDVFVFKKHDCFWIVVLVMGVYRLVDNLWQHYPADETAAQAHSHGPATSSRSVRQDLVHTAFTKSTEKQAVKGVVVGVPLEDARDTSIQNLKEVAEEAGPGLTGIQAGKVAGTALAEVNNLILR